SGLGSHPPEASPAPCGSIPRSHGSDGPFRMARHLKCARTRADTRSDSVLRSGNARGRNGMILVVFVGVAAATVPLARGRLMNLAQLRFRRCWLLAASLALLLWLMLLVWSTH